MVAENTGKEERREKRQRKRENEGREKRKRTRVKKLARESEKGVRGRDLGGGRRHR